MQLPRIDHCGVDRICYQWPIPLLATNPNTVIDHCVIEQVHTFHAIVVLVDQMRLINCNHFLLLSILPFRPGHRCVFRKNIVNFLLPKFIEAFFVRFFIWLHRFYFCLLKPRHLHIPNETKQSEKHRIIIQAENLENTSKFL